MELKEHLNDDLRRQRTRVKKRYTSKYLIKDYYAFYKEHRVRTTDIEQKIANCVYKEFNKEISKQIVLFNFEFKLPGGLGKIRIQKRNPIKPSLDENGNLKSGGVFINFNETRKLWARDPKAKAERKKVYKLFNDNKDNDYSYKWLWAKHGYAVRNKGVYKFIPSRANRQLLAYALNSDSFHTDYFK